MATAAALPHLQESGGLAAYLSSVSASTGRPWTGLGVYTTTKAALNRMIEAFAVEHPEVRFSRVVVGDTMGGEGASATEFASGWDAEYAGEAMQTWFQRGYVTGSLMPADEFLTGIDFLLSSRASVPTISLTPNQDPRLGRIELDGALEA